jgi:DNA-binding NarL/FixJ family response regulator
MAGISGNTVRDIEHRHTLNPAYLTLKKLAKALNVDLPDIKEGHAKWQRQGSGPMKERREEKRNRAINFVVSLSQMQLIVLGLLAQGYTNEKIAKELRLSLKTVKNHLSRAYQKLKVGKGEDPRTLAVVLYMLAFEQGQREKHLH